MRRAAAKGTQVTAEDQGLAARRGPSDCNMFLANLSSAELDTRGYGLGNWGVRQRFSQNSWVCQKTQVPISLTF